MPQKPKCRALKLIALLWVLVGIFNFAAAAEKQSPPTPHLTPDRVLELAIAAFSRTDAGSRPYRPLPPEFHSDRSAWWVHFAQTSSWARVDGDMLVVVDDRTGSTCVQQFIAVGKCI